MKPLQGLRWLFLPGGEAPPPGGGGLAPPGRRWLVEDYPAVCLLEATDACVSRTLHSSILCKRKRGCVESHLRGVEVGAGVGGGG